MRIRCSLSLLLQMTRVLAEYLIPLLSPSLTLVSGAISERAHAHLVPFLSAILVTLDRAAGQYTVVEGESMNVTISTADAESFTVTATAKSCETGYTHMILCIVMPVLCLFLIS